MEHKTSKSWSPAFVRTSWLQTAAGFLRGNLGVGEEAEEGLQLLRMTSSHPAQNDSPLSAAIGSQAWAVGPERTPVPCDGQVYV